MNRLLAAGSVAATLLAAGPARAEDVDRPRPRISEQIADGVTGFDLRGDNVSLGFRSDVQVRGGVARVDARIDLRVVGRHVHVELPDFEVVPRSYDGDRYVELRLPLLTGRF